MNEKNVALNFTASEKCNFYAWKIHAEKYEFLYYL